MAFATTQARRMRHPLPGFGLSLGLGMAWLGLIVLLPLAALVVRAAGLGWLTVRGPGGPARRGGGGPAGPW